MTETTVHELNKTFWKDGKIVSHVCNYAGHIFKHKRLGTRVRVAWWNSLDDTVSYIQDSTIKQQVLSDFDDLFEYVGKAKYSGAELDELSIKIEGEE